MIIINGQISRKLNRTEWGERIAIWGIQHNISLKEICDSAGVNYTTFRHVMRGKTTGDNVQLTEKVEAFMARHEAELSSGRKEA